MRIEEFDDRGPRLDLFAYFEGRTTASGIFEDRFGRLRRSFTVDIRGSRTGTDGFALEEDFVYDDGTRERRVWRLRRVAADHYEGRADDVIGIAQGCTAGNAFNWRYVLALKIGGWTWNVGFDDWMFLQQDGVLINRARLSKWGMELGQVTLAFRREQGDTDYARAAA